MNIEIWSDVMCPFCYIGKHNFEKALAQVEGAERVKVDWKSFQLNRDLGTEGMSALDYLSTTKGMAASQLDASFKHITQSGRELGLNFDFSKAVVVNTAAAHRLIQLAKTKGRGSEAEDLFFKAHFSEGKNVADVGVLHEIGSKLGFSKDEINSAQTEEKYRNALDKDLYEAGQIGVQGVPFFVFDRKYAISGAQPVELFVQTIKKALEESIALEQIVGSGPGCDLEGNCE